MNFIWYFGYGQTEYEFLTYTKPCSEYEWLLGMSMTARYHRFQYDQLVVDKAVRLMKQIKKACQP